MRENEKHIFSKNIFRKANENGSEKARTKWSKKELLEPPKIKGSTAFELVSTHIKQIGERKERWKLPHDSIAQLSLTPQATCQLQYDYQYKHWRKQQSQPHRHASILRSEFL